MLTSQPPAWLRLLFHYGVAAAVERDVRVLSVAEVAVAAWAGSTAVAAGRRRQQVAPSLGMMPGSQLLRYPEVSTGHLKLCLFKFILITG